MSPTADDGSAAQRPALPPPNPLLGATVDDEPAVPLVATCGATLTDPVTPSVRHICSRVDDHRLSPVGLHWDHSTDMTWPVGSAARRDDRPLCVLNRCGRRQGLGTWCQIAGRDKPQPVCEEHWQALSRIFPLEVTGD